MMPTSWELTELQQQAITLRAALAAAQQVVEKYAADWAIADAYDRDWKARRDAIRARMAEIGPSIDAAGQARRYQTAEEIDEYRRLGREISDLEASRARWLDARTIHWTDAIGRQQSYVLIPSDVERYLQAARQRRDVAAAALADVERRLSAGELVETGVPAAEYVEYRERVEALRARLA